MSNEKETLDKIMNNISAINSFIEVAKFHYDLQKGYEAYFTKEEAFAISTNIICSMITHATQQPPEGTQ